MFDLIQILFFVSLLNTTNLSPVSSPQEVSSSIASKSSQATTRSELLTQQRMEKEKNLSPYKLGKLEKGLLRLETKGYHESLGFRFGDFYVSQGGITTGAGIAATGRYFKPNLFGTPIDVSASAGYSLKQYGLYSFQVGNILRKSPELFLRSTSSGGLTLFEKTKEREGNFYLYAEIAYRDFTQEDFYGLGTDSEKEDRTDYRVVGPSYEGVGALRFGENFGAFLRAGLFQPDLRRGKDSAFPNTQELFDDVTAPGLDQQPDFLRLATQVFWDYRDIPGNPDIGGLFGITLAKYFDRDGDQFDFYRVAFDARQYIPLWSEQRMLAVRFYTSMDEESGDARVPFYLMQTLGGSDSLRGYPDFRFRDKNVFLISTEYRWEPTPAVELVLFYDTGKVFQERSDFDFSNLKKGYGFGIRFKTSDSVLLRLDIGHSEEGTSIYLKWAASF
jgi:outer membrane protein assembly factor BamA